MANACEGCWCLTSVAAHLVHVRRRIRRRQGVDSVGAVEGLDRSQAQHDDEPRQRRHLKTLKDGRFHKILLFAKQGCAG